MDEPAFSITEDPCGSGLARDEGRTFNIAVDGDAAIAGKPAPTGFCVDSKFSRDRSIAKPSRCATSGAPCPAPARPPHLGP
ncbi:hypothetical protein CUN61_23315 [Pseudomonas arsenicoxydans]|uniref:Uncharacterized protein n=1 Tax=Pseudomonas arsenicoxydans TaxID=702115 RepID=A0A4P6G583_9PSED|nr:hypothetical protein CUN61_23315 [Pseudomonas arsenicoxydans]